MKFVEYKDVSRNRIRGYEHNKVLINADWHHFPCAIAPHLIENDWQAGEKGIQPEQIQALQQHYLADLVLIGTEHEPVWNTDWLKLQAALNQLGIGVEQMRHDAAIRTFNVLTTEERPVWLILR